MFLVGCRLVYVYLCVCVLVLMLGRFGDHQTLPFCIQKFMRRMRVNVTYDELLVNS